MNLNELREFLNHDLADLAKKPNTSEYKIAYRKAIDAAYELNDYPVLRDLRDAWRVLDSYTNYSNYVGNSSDESTPLSHFMLDVDLGSYPPPEVMLSLLSCFQNYYASAGEKSLDEVFFGRPHKKKTSPAFLKNRNLFYQVFDVTYASGGVFGKGSVEMQGKSLAEKAAHFLNGATRDEEDFDPETFLKGFRRWKRKFKEGRE